MHDMEVAVDRYLLGSGHDSGTGVMIAKLFMQITWIERVRAQRWQMCQWHGIFLVTQHLVDDEICFLGGWMIDMSGRFGI